MIDISLNLAATPYLHYRIIAGVFDYPDAALADTVEEVQTILNQRYPEAALIFQPFSEFVLLRPLTVVVEQFVNAFSTDNGSVINNQGERQPVTACVSDAGLDCSLGDLLRWFSTVGDGSLLHDYSVSTLLPCIVNILDKLANPKHQMYRAAVEALYTVIAEDFRLTGSSPTHPSSDN